MDTVKNPGTILGSLSLIGLTTSFIYLQRQIEELKNTKNFTEMKEVDDRINQILSQINNLSSDMETINNTITEMKQDFKVLKNAVSSGDIHKNSKRRNLETPKTLKSETKIPTPVVDKIENRPIEQSIDNEQSEDDEDPIKMVIRLAKEKASKTV